MERNESQRSIVIWLYTGCFLVFAMVVIGGITRLTGSGLSITEWNLVTGTFPPLTDWQWEQEFAKYQASPQFQTINSHFGLTDFKQIYWWEYIHRLIGRLLGIVFMIPFVYFLIKKQVDKRLLPKLIIILALGALQGILGWYMVKSGLVRNPFVSHYRLAMHLINAFITFGYIYWVALDLSNSTIKREQNSSAPRQLSIFAFALLIIQIIYGGFVAGLHSGHVFNTWPKMGDEWVASSVAMAWEKTGWMSLFDDIATVQFVHRTNAVLMFTLIAGMWVSRNNIRWNLDSTQKNALSVNMAIVLLQALLGIFTLLYSVPVWLGVLHQVGAFAIFAGMIYQLHALARR